MAVKPTQKPNQQGLTPEQQKLLDDKDAMEQRTNAIMGNYRHSLDNGYAWTAADTISENLGKGTLKLGFTDASTFDTGIPWTHKKSQALAIGFGDQVGDIGRGLSQYMKEKGMADLIDVQAQDENEEILRQLYTTDSSFQNASWFGAGLGAIAEPASLAMPLGKIRSVAKAMAAGAAMGTIYGSALYVDQNESRLTNAAISAVMLGGMGGIAAKYFRSSVGTAAADAIEDSIGVPFTKPHIKLKVNPKKEKPTNESAVEDFEIKAALEGKRHVKVSEMGKVFNRFMQPLHDNVRKYSKVIADKLRDTDAKHHVTLKRWTDRTQSWNDWLDNIPIQTQKNIHKLLANGGFNAATMKYIQQAGGSNAVRAADQVQSVLKDIFKAYKDAGYRVKHIKDYFPNSVRDLESLVKREKGMIEKVLAAAKIKKGKALTTNEKAHIAERMFSFDIRRSSTGTALKDRKKREILDDELGFYHDPVTALHYYIASAAEDVAKRNFFKGFGYVAPKKGLDVYGGDITDSIDTLLDTMRKQIPDLENQKEVGELLSARFNANVHKTHRFIQGVKNASYASTLGNWWAAATQVGDLIFAIHKYGIAASVKSILGPNITTKEMLGLEKAMQELVSDRGITNTIADKAFKWSGFDMIDRFGKNVNINSSLRVNKKLAIKNPAKFREKWGNHFGKETENVIDELSNIELKKGADLSDNVYLMLWNDLADTQPIGLSEMPQKYLNNPNGRIFYAYKTFAIKQFAYMRNILTDKSRNGAKRAADLVYFASMFVLANGSIDQFKDFMAGKELDFEDKLIDNLVSMVGTSKYAVDKSKGPAQIISEGLKPVPWTQGERVVNSAYNNIAGKGNLTQLLLDVFHQVPIVGKAYKNWEIIE